MTSAQTLRYALAAAIGISALFAQAANTHPQSTPRVSVALALCADTSGSIDAREYALQNRGTANALRSQAVRDQVVYRGGGLAITYLEFDTQTRERIGWRILRNNRDIDLIAGEIETLERLNTGGTHVDSCMAFGLAAMDRLPVRANRLVIDLSGDEFAESRVGAAADQRDRAHHLGVQINTLPILNIQSEGAVTPAPGAWSLRNFSFEMGPFGKVFRPMTRQESNEHLENGFRTHVQTQDGFTYRASNFDDFERAMSRKMAVEIGALPQSMLARRP